MNKKILFALIAFSIAVIPISVMAQSGGSTCSSSDGGGFVSLTCIKNLEFAGNATELPAFFNSIYMICIGLAAVIGVLQIMRAGVTWMTAGGSHEKIGDAKNLIRDTIIGLILVLAPTIVFSIINPEILSLKIGDLDKLAPGSVPGPGSSTTPTLSATSCSAAYKDWNTQAIPADKVCNAANGYRKIDNACCSGISAGSICCGNQYSPKNPPPSMIPNTIGTNSPQSNQACKTAYADGTPLPPGNQAEQFCCQYQDAYGVTCDALSNPRDNGQSMYCSCTSK